MQCLLRILVVVLTTQSVGCAMLVGGPNQNTTVHDDHSSSPPNAPKLNYEGNVVAWQYSPIVARSTANNSSLGAKATEVVEAERAEKLEARRLRDQRFAEVQKEVNALLQQRQSAPVVTEALPPPTLPIDETSSVEPLRREVKKKLYLDDAQFQHVSSTAVSPIAVAPLPWQSVGGRPLAIITMVVLVLSGVTWPLTRNQRLALLFARFHRPAENNDTQAVLDHSDSTQPSIDEPQTPSSCRFADETMSSDFDGSLDNTCLEVETCFSSCDPIAEDKQAWLSELQSASTDFMVVCVASWSQDDLIAPTANKSGEFATSPHARIEAEAVTREQRDAPLKTPESESIATDTVLPAAAQATATACRALIAVNQRIVIGIPQALPTPLIEHADLGVGDTSGTSSSGTTVTASTSVANVAKPKPRGVSLMGLPAKGPAKPVFPKLMPPVQVRNVVGPQNHMIVSVPVIQPSKPMGHQHDDVESIIEDTARGSFQHSESIDSAQKFVGFVVLFADDGTIGSFQKLMIVESFQLKDQSELIANVVRVA